MMNNINLRRVLLLFLLFHEEVHTSDLSYQTVPIFNMRRYMQSKILSKVYVSQVNWPQEICQLVLKFYTVRIMKIACDLKKTWYQIHLHHPLAMESTSSHNLKMVPRQTAPFRTTEYGYCFPVWGCSFSYRIG